MTLTIGDRLLIKRNGMILTSDAGEAFYEYEVIDHPKYLGIDENKAALYTVTVKVIK